MNTLARFLATGLACLGLVTGQHITVWSGCQALAHDRPAVAQGDHQHDGDERGNRDHDDGEPHHCTCPVAACCALLALASDTPPGLQPQAILVTGDRWHQLALRHTCSFLIPYALPPPQSA